MHVPKPYQEQKINTPTAVQVQVEKFNLKHFNFRLFVKLLKGGASGPIFE